MNENPHAETMERKPMSRAMKALLWTLGTVMVAGLLVSFLLLTPLGNRLRTSLCPPWGKSTITLNTNTPATAVVATTKTNAPKLVATVKTNSETQMDKMAKAISVLCSNQIVTMESLQDFTSKMASNNASIRAEIPGIVETVVEKKLAKAIQPFERLLSLTNPPAPVAPAPVTKKAKTPRTAIVATSPSGVTNNNLLVVNMPPQSLPKPPAAIPATGQVVFHNNNTMVVHDRQLPPHPPGEKPYWMRDLFPK